MKYFFFLFLLFSFTFSFAPEPTPYNLIEICESTGGEVIETFQEIDCGPGCNAMPLTHSDCSCPDGITYMNIDYMHDFQGCTGEKPICFDDAGCVRTGQGNLCDEEGYCVQGDLVLDNENSVCLGFSVLVVFFLLLLTFSKV